MSKRLFIQTCVLLAVTTHATSQYIDFFQSLNSYLQPLTTPKPRNVVTKRPVTKHRQTNKQKYQDVILFDDDVIKAKENARFIDPFNFYSTTTKPRRKIAKTSTTSHSSNTYTTRPNKTVNSNKIINNNINHEATSSISDNIRQPYNNNVDNNVRRIDNGHNDNYNGYSNGFNNYNTNSETTSNRATNSIFGYQSNNYNTNRQTTPKTTTDYYNNQRQTTRKTTTDYYNNQRQTTQRTTTDYYNNQRQSTYNYGQTTNFYDNERTTRRPNNRPHERQTTSNPLLNRPGVIPAVVNENKPPITNRPVTERPVYDRPFDSGTFRPVNTRPPYEIERTTKRPLETRPANTRPPYEIERPTAGVHRPITSGVRPGSSGFRPDTSGFRPDTSGFRPDTSGVKPVVSGSNENEEPDIEIGPDEDEMSDSEKRRLYNICEQKCEEYKAAKVRKVVALPLAPNSQGVELNVSSCAPTNVPLIIGGEVVRIQQFPHMALVGWKKILNGGYSWKCGGSLLSEQFVLTAGHCTYHDKDDNAVSGPPHAVQLGSSLYNDRSATVVQISTVIRHPKYKLRRSYHDVALIKLVNTIEFSDTISPACLGVPPPVGEPVIATGWGKTEFGGDSSLELRSVSIPIWDMTECRDIWGTSLKLPNGPMSDSQICAGERKGAKDTCQGDSGGPAQVQDACLWRVVAVTSVGRSCGARDTPALYATVPRAFIASQVYTNVKMGRDGNDQYGNAGTNNNRDNLNNNKNNGNNNSGFGLNNQFGNRGVANVRPIENNNGNNGRLPNNNRQYNGDSQSSGSNNQGVVNNNWGNNNEHNFANNRQTPGNNNAWSVPTVTANNNGYEQNNGYLKDQNYRTTTHDYNHNNYGQNTYNTNYGQIGSQNGRNTEYPSDIRYYSTQNSGYNDGRTYNRDNDDRYSSYAVAHIPRWNR